jgi:lactoylglutathione lyase
MKSLPISLIVIFFSFSQAMSQQAVLDHIAIYVTDLKKSSAFYRDVLGLDSLPEPFHDGKHAWFAIGPGNQLHIIEGATSRADQPKRNHTCFRIASLQEFIIRLTKAGIASKTCKAHRAPLNSGPMASSRSIFETGRVLD